MRWQWHQLDHMQVICTSLQTDNHASTLSLIFNRPDGLPDAQPAVSKHWILPLLLLCCIMYVQLQLHANSFTLTNVVHYSGRCVGVLQGCRLYILWDGVRSASVCRLCGRRATTSDRQVAWNAEWTDVAGRRSAARVPCVRVPAIPAWTASQARSTVSQHAVQPSLYHSTTLGSGPRSLSLTSASMMARGQNNCDLGLMYEKGFCCCVPCSRFLTQKAFNRLPLSVKVQLYLEKFIITNST